MALCQVLFSGAKATHVVVALRSKSPKTIDTTSNYARRNGRHANTRLLLDGSAMTSKNGRGQTAGRLAGWTSWLPLYTKQKQQQAGLLQLTEFRSAREKIAQNLDWTGLCGLLLR